MSYVIYFTRGFFFNFSIPSHSPITRCRSRTFLAGSWVVSSIIKSLVRQLKYCWCRRRHTLGCHSWLIPTKGTARYIESFIQFGFFTMLKSPEAFWGVDASWHQNLVFSCGDKVFIRLLSLIQWFKYAIFLQSFYLYRQWLEKISMHPLKVFTSHPDGVSSSDWWPGKF